MSAGRQVYVAVVTYDSADYGAGTDAVEVFTARRKAESFAFDRLAQMDDVGRINRQRAASHTSWIGYPKQLDRYGATTEVTGYANVYRREAR